MKYFLVACILGLFAQGLAQDAPPVKIDLYYETLCPYSIEYFVSQLYPTWVDLNEIMDVHLYPFGNADYVANAEGGWNFTCQHGADECTGNLIHACAQLQFKDDISTEMDFVYCLLSAEYPPDAGQVCAEQVGTPWAPIDACVNSLDGQIALHDVALEQEKLDPSLYFVPWIVVDDFFSEDQVTACQTDQKDVVCTTYTGLIVPTECAGPKNKMALKPVTERCYEH